MTGSRPEAPSLTSCFSRTKPETLDISIALAAGVAGAYVTVKREAVSAPPARPSPLVLIAPLAAFGIALEIGRNDLASGAILFYVTNLAGIVLAATVTFILTRGRQRALHEACMMGPCCRGARGSSRPRCCWRRLAATRSAPRLNMPSARRRRRGSATATSRSGPRPSTARSCRSISKPPPASTVKLAQMIDKRPHRQVELTVLFTQQQQLAPATAPPRTP